MSRRYQKPTVIRLGSVSSGKHDLPVGAHNEIREEIDGVPVARLVENFGSPLFVYSERQIVDRYHAAYEAFAGRYPDVQFGWSYKTNYLKGVCALYHREGAVAEVVSDFEYEKARNLGVPGPDIIYNGPGKSAESLLTAAREGARIHCDSMEEIKLLESVATELGRSVPVAIRLNMATGMHDDWSRFGFNIESGQAANAVRRMQSTGKLELVGLHCHIGTFVLDPESYRRAVTKVVAFMLAVEARFGCRVAYLDLGGGLASQNRLRGVYQAPEVAVPAVDDYAEAITQPLHELLPPDRRPQLVLELGRHLIDEAGFLITTVLAHKLLPDGRRSYVIDAGVNLLYASSWYKLNVELDGEETGVPEPAILHGPLCMNIDVVDEATMLPRLSAGKRLVLSPVGAYNLTQSMQFIRYRPAVVLLPDGGEATLLRRRETLEDLERAEVMPPHLRPGEQPP